MKKLDLGHDNITKLLFTFAIPCVVSMLINSVYNIVDQIFIGVGVGTLGNAATNVIFPLVIICNAIAGLIGNGTSANMSLKLGEGDIASAKKSIGSSITVLVVISFIISIISYLLLPKLVYLFGCTKDVYSYAIDYGRIILIGAPFMIIYTGLSNIIRADGSPKYSMIVLVVGAIINLILDPICIFGFNMGVKGGALATIIGQIVSFIMASLYLTKFKSVTIESKDFKVNNSIFRVMALGLSSFITQGTVLALFVFMNNIMTKYGALSKFGENVPLSVYGVISKFNSLYISSILGISIGAQPIIGFNFGAGNYDRVRETLKKVLLINFIIGLFFNIIFVLFPKEIVSIFISQSDPLYDLFIEFAVLLCRSFMLVCGLNFLEMTTSIVVQSLGNVVKATAVSFTRQIILFIPIASILCIVLGHGIYGALYAGAIADSICFIICIFLFTNEYKKVGKLNKAKEETNEEVASVSSAGVVITIAREYGSGGRYVGELLAKKLNVNFYDKELIRLSAKESGLSQEYVENIEEKNSNAHYENNNDDRLFIAEFKVIKDLAKNSCVIVGRCSNYILKDNKNVVNIFLYSDMDFKIKRAVKYYKIDENKAPKIIEKINRDRAKHYKYYTNTTWNDPSNYDLMLNVDKIGVEKCVSIIEEYIKK